VLADPELCAQANARHAAQAAEASKQPSSSQRHSKTGTQAYIYDPHRIDKMFDMLTKYEENFARHLKILLDTLNYLAATETVVFLSLCARLSSAGEGGIIASSPEGGFGI
jgi:gamma-tubulin complex component 2